jgi:hypothetical protein
LASTSACFASGSTVSAWSTNGTHTIAVSQTAQLGTVALTGLRTGFDVQCNDPTNAALLPGNTSTVGFVSAVLGDVTGDGIVDASFVLTDGPLALGVGDGSGAFVAAQVCWKDPLGAGVVCCQLLVWL